MSRSICTRLEDIVNRLGIRHIMYYLVRLDDSLHITENQLLTYVMWTSEHIPLALKYRFQSMPV